MICLADKEPHTPAPKPNATAQHGDDDYSLSDMALDIEETPDEEEDALSHSDASERDSVSSTATGDSGSLRNSKRSSLSRSPSPSPVSSAGDKELTLRLLFPHEDGGVLIGKEGRYINKLKEASSATWFITSNNTNHEDRVVILRGSIGSIADGVRELAKHLCEQSKSAATADTEPNAKTLTLRFLFPFKCVGAIVGPGGSYVQKLRTEPGIHRLHIYKSTIPFTQERIVEVGATAQGMETASAWLLKHTKSNLTQLQESSTLYKPVRDGLRQFLAINQRPANSADSHDSARLATASSTPTSHLSAGGEGSRKRSRSMLGLGHADSADGSAAASSSAHKRARRLSDNNSDRGKGDSSRPRSGSSTRPRRHSPSSSLRGSHSSMGISISSSRRGGHGSSSGNGREREEKLVIPDRVAGRLIGRNGTHLALLQDRSGTHIQLSPRVENMSDRIVTIVGRPDKVTTACRLIRDSVRSFEDLEQ